MTQSLSRRSLLGGGLAVGSAVALGACANLTPHNNSAPAVGGKKAAGGVGSIRFSSYGDPTKLKLRSDLAAKFTSEHPKIKVGFEGVASADYWDKLATEIAGGTATDVINIDSPHISQYGTSGALQPLDPYIPKPIETDTFDSNLLKSGQLNGKQYGVPVASATTAMGYDATIIDSLGLKRPDGGWNWDGFMSFAQQIYKKSGGKYNGSEDPSGDSAVFELWARSNGQQLYKDDKTFGFTQDTLSDYFTYWQEMRTSGGCVPAQTAAQYVYADWVHSPMVLKKAPLGRIQTNNVIGGYQGFTKDDIELTMVPKGNDGKYPNYEAASSYLSLNAKTQDPTDAAVFLNWFANSADAALTLRVISGPPASSAGRKALLDSGGLSSDEKKVLNFTTLAIKNSTPPPIPAPGVNTDIGTLLLAAAQSVSFKKKSIKDAVSTFWDGGQKALESS